MADAKQSPFESPIKPDDKDKAAAEVDSSVIKPPVDEAAIDLEAPKVVGIESIEVVEPALDLGTVVEIPLKEAGGVGPIPHVLAAGKILTQWVLVIISAFIFVWLVSFLYIEQEKSNEIKMIKGQYNKLIINSTKPVEDNKRKLLEETLNTVKEDLKEFRAFWLDILKTVLINVLLPVLTALLGYTFGVTRNNEQGDGS